MLRIRVYCTRHSTTAMASRVAVIGAGPLGLMAVKNMKEAGLDVTCYEARSWVGG